MTISPKIKNILLVLAPLAIGFFAFMLGQSRGEKKHAQREKAAAVALAKVEVERDHIAAKLVKINTRLDSAQKALAEKPKQIEKIKIRYVEKRDSIRVLPFNERLGLFAKRLAAGGAR